MGPLVRDEKRALERKDIGRDERLEKKRIGHAVYARAPEVHVERRPLRTRRHDRRAAPQIADRAVQSIDQTRVDRVGGRPADRVRLIVQRVQPFHGVRGSAPRGVAGHMRCVERQCLDQRNAAIIQSPRREEREVGRRAPGRRAYEDDEHAAAAPRPGADVAPREPNPRGRSRRRQQVQQRDRREIRHRREQRLHAGIQSCGIQAIDRFGRGRRHGSDDGSSEQ